MICKKIFGKIVDQIEYLWLHNKLEKIDFVVIFLCEIRDIERMWHFEEQTEFSCHAKRLECKHSVDVTDLGTKKIALRIATDGDGQSSLPCRRSEVNGEDNIQKIWLKDKCQKGKNKIKTEEVCLRLSWTY